MFESRSEFEVLALHAALEKLTRLDPRSARAIELLAFGGLTTGETALVPDVAKRTVNAEGRVGRMWLGREFGRPVA